MAIVDLLEQIKNDDASDIFIVSGRPLSYKARGQLFTVGTNKLMPDETDAYVSEIYSLAGNRNMDRLRKCGDDDFSFALAGIARFRINAYKQRGSLSAVIRVINFNIPDYHELLIPEKIMGFSDFKKGLVLVTGPAGSGKSTTLACMIDHINKTRQSHIITLEDPLEYLHRHDLSIVSQREVITDTDSYLTALRASLRQSPDVILLGEMRDFETMSVAMTAAETGHLILSTLHTIGASNTIDRIIDAFPPSQQHQIAVQLSMVLQAVVSQQLIPTKDGGIVPAFEIMTLTPAIKNMIRESKVHQIDGMIATSRSEGMISMDTSLLELVQSGKVDEKVALEYAQDADLLLKKIRNATSLRDS
ncbi:MAG: PilT/PilU family type 4a pilus ATPase [Lachnospiraceae bacterium]|nr:PilT/PilU family type 4a pilus ATPase [Lachnospiraceae bacterium]